jgi:glycosyltransferase involved in cell wall biosynthesis
MTTFVKRVLITIPAYNEEATIESVVRRVRECLPDCELLVINDGSSDLTGEILRKLDVLTATHLCNLGYGRTIQTAVKYALRNNYDVLITLDADSQHYPEQVRSLLEELTNGKWDMVIGSRHDNGRRNYSGVPVGRRIGMQLFSILVKLASGKRIYDTSSGLKVMARSVFMPLTYWHFVDFHAEAIVYLLRQGYRIREYPIVVAKRVTGKSMYSALSYLKYPLKTLLMVVLGIVQASLPRKGDRQ